MIRTIKVWRYETDITKDIFYLNLTLIIYIDKFQRYTRDNNIWLSKRMPFFRIGEFRFKTQHIHLQGVNGCVYNNQHYHKTVSSPTARLVS